MLLSRTVHYYAELGQCSVFAATEAPEQFISQVTVLKYFSHYMEENLMDVSIHCGHLEILNAMEGKSMQMSSCPSRPNLVLQDGLEPYLIN